MEAQRFPEDYDGIIAGAPVYDWVGEMTEQAWNVRALRQTPAGALSPEKLRLLHRAVVKACGGPDGQLEDPRKCSFDPSTLKCDTPAQSSCLTDGEVAAVRQMYAGPKTSAAVRIYPGLSRGSESDWDWLWSDPKRLGGSWLEFYRFMVFQNPSWNLSMLDFDRDPSVAEQKVGQVLNPMSPDLSGFAKRGGKIIIYHGWADDMVPSQVSIDYYDSLNSTLGPKKLEEFYRLFMVPGMWHCGRGPDVLFRSEDAVAIPLEPERDMLTTLERWVEGNRAPNSFVTSRLSKDGTVERTQLLCAYPSVAVFSGSGDPMLAQNWVCPEK
jgi:feruloyl esterase